MGDKFTYRPPDGLLDRVKAIAEERGHSVNAEITELVEAGIEAEESRESDGRGDPEKGHPRHGNGRCSGAGAGHDEETEGTVASPESSAEVESLKSERDSLKATVDILSRQLDRKDEQIAALMERADGTADIVAALSKATEAVSGAVESMAGTTLQAQALHGMDMQRQLPEQAERPHKRRGLLAWIRGE